MQNEKSSGKQFSLPCDEALTAKIEDFRYSNRIPTAALAIRRLVEDGLATHLPKQTESA